MESLRKQKLDSLIALIQDVFGNQKSFDLLKMLSKCLHTISDEEITKLRNELRGIKTAGRSKTSDSKIEGAYNYTYDILRVAIVHANNYKTGRLAIIEEHQRALKDLNWKINGFGKSRLMWQEKASEVDKMLSVIKEGLKPLVNELAGVNKELQGVFFKERAALYKKLQQVSDPEQKTGIKKEIGAIDSKIGAMKTRADKLRDKIDAFTKKRDEYENSHAYKQLGFVENEIAKLQYEKDKHSQAIQKLRDEIGGR